MDNKGTSRRQYTSLVAVRWLAAKPPSPSDASSVKEPSMHCTEAKWSEVARMGKAQAVSTSGSVYIKAGRASTHASGEMEREVDVLPTSQR